MIFYHFNEYTPDDLTADFIKTTGSVFVFGSNNLGQHMGGAARFAHDELGAQWGVGRGVTSDNSYAIATLETPNSLGRPEKISKRDIRHQFYELVVHAQKHPDRKFFVTKIGLGIAGFTLDEIAYAFTGVNIPENVIIPWEIATYSE